MGGRPEISTQARFALGVCYYPEHRPRDRREPYARRMRELGLTYVRLSEFAWSRSLIAEALEDRLQQAGIATMNLPGGVRVSRCGRHEVWMNFSSEAAATADGATVPAVGWVIRNRERT